MAKFKARATDATGAVTSFLVTAVDEQDARNKAREKYRRDGVTFEIKRHGATRPSVENMEAAVASTLERMKEIELDINPNWTAEDVLLAMKELVERHIRMTTRGTGITGDPCMARERS